MTNWLEKNKDPLNDSLVTVLKASTGNALLPEIWESYTTQEELMDAQKSNFYYHQMEMKQNCLQRELRKKERRVNLARS